MLRFVLSSVSVRLICDSEKFRSLCCLKFVEDRMHQIVLDFDVKLTLIENRKVGSRMQQFVLSSMSVGLIRDSKQIR